MVQLLSNRVSLRFAAVQALVLLTTHIDPGTSVSNLDSQQSITFMIDCQWMILLFLRSLSFLQSS
jgi:hypothetical protein